MLQPRNDDVGMDEVGVETRIAQLAGQGLGSRRIAAELEAEGYLAMSHMTVARILWREAALPPE